MPQRSETLTFPHRWETGREKNKTKTTTNKQTKIKARGAAVWDNPNTLKTLSPAVCCNSCSRDALLLLLAVSTAWQKPSIRKKQKLTKLTKTYKTQIKRRPALIWQWQKLGKTTMTLQLFSWVRKQEVGHQGMSSKTTLPLIGWGRQTGCQTD